MSYVELSSGTTASYLRQSSAIHADVVMRLIEDELTIACAESLTGGRLADAFVNVPGSSQVFVGSAVTYATRAKHDVLGVDGTLLARNGPVDPEVAAQMARGAKHLFSADIGVAVTGVAGPTPQDGKPVGLVYAGFSGIALPQAIERASRVLSLDVHQPRDLEQDEFVLRLDLRHSQSDPSLAWIHDALGEDIKQGQDVSQRNAVRSATVQVVMSVLMEALKNSDR